MGDARNVVEIKERLLKILTSQPLLHCFIKKARCKALQTVVLMAFF